jgi:hypothetical protein
MELKARELYAVDDFGGAEAGAEFVADCTMPGMDASAAVEQWIGHLGLSADPEAVRGYLGEFGAWDEDELADDEANLLRLVWVAACELRESGEWYFGF